MLNKETTELLVYLTRTRIQWFLFRNYLFQHGVVVNKLNDSAPFRLKGGLLTIRFIII